MKKYFVLVLMFLPMVSFGASSVRMLGGSKAAASTVSNSGTKVTPVRAATTTASASAPRVGTLRAKSKTSGVITTGGNSSNSRFPSITPIQSYNSVVTPQQNNQVIPAPTTATVDFDKGALVKEIMDNVDAGYYNKANVYDNDEFRDAVKAVDDPRIDAVRVGTAPVRTGTLPDDYVEIWIER